MLLFKCSNLSCILDNVFSGFLMAFFNCFLAGNFNLSSGNCFLAYSTTSLYIFSNSSLSSFISMEFPSLFSPNCSSSSSFLRIISLIVSKIAWICFSSATLKEDALASILVLSKPRDPNLTKPFSLANLTTSNNVLVITSGNSL